MNESLIEELKTMTAESNSIITQYQQLGVTINTAFDTQVLLQQYKHYCQSKRCLDCAIGISLLGRK